VLRPHHIRDVCNGGYSEEELRALLAEERVTARRQQLLKALWKLSQQQHGEDSRVTAKKAMAGSTTTRQLSDMASQQGKSLSISC
jgi:hypothetical protein